MIEKKKTGRPKLISSDKLAEALFQVFAQKGYASTSIADLTHVTGMKPPSLYLAFGNKEGMYAAALMYYRQHWLGGGWNSVCRIKHKLSNNGCVIFFMTPLRCSVVTVNRWGAP